jgi:hypothetical protein
MAGQQNINVGGKQSSLCWLAVPNFSVQRLIELHFLECDHSFAVTKLN